MHFEEKEKKFDIHEFEIAEDEQRHNPEAEVRLPGAERSAEASASRSQSRSRKEKEKKPPTYNWAFFVASFMFGLAATATFDIPGPLFIGMGVGFLFFVEPFYQRVMAWIEKL